MNNIKILILILALIATVDIIDATSNDTNNTNITATPTPNETVNVTPTPNQTASPTPTPNQTVSPTPTPNQTNVPTITPTITPIITAKIDKFRVGPTVRIRPLDDEIDINQDGIIELYMDNPSLNDVTLNVDVRVSVPAGVHVSGQGFGDAGSAGTVYSKFSISPGQSKTININIRGDRTGNFYAQLSGTYWPGDNKDAYQPMSLTHNFRVYESSFSNGNVEKAKTKDKNEKGVLENLADLLGIISNKLLEILNNILKNLIRDIGSD